MGSHEGNTMKKLFCLLICLGLVAGCSGESEKDTSKKDAKTEQKETKKESDLDIANKIFTFETEDVDGTIMGIAKDNGVKNFSMYISFNEQDKEIADALGITKGEMIYHLNGDDSETYLITTNQVFVTMTDATSESMAENMNKYLKEKGITLDQLKNAMNETFK